MIVSLLTDFGRSDHFAASLRGVILSTDARIQVMDITHYVPPHDIEYAAFVLLCCFRDFPPGTVHLAVVDPDVGSSRRALAARAEDRLFVGPDNGIFSWALESAGSREVWEIGDPAGGRGAISTTFHGRDVFAPVAAALATGQPVEEVGGMVPDPVTLRTLRNSRLAGGVVEGRLLHIDRFGNCVTSLTAADFPDRDWRNAVVHAGGVRVSDVRRYYADGTGERPFLILGSSGFLEISVERDSAAATLNLRRGDPVTAELR